MGAYTKVTIESDSKGRVSINALDDKGSGHGHRLAGPKYVGDLVPGVEPARPIADTALDARDIDALREYANVWDGINLGHLPGEVHALSDALRRYLNDRAGAARFPEYQDRPHNIERAERTRADLIKACSALVAVLGGAK